VEAVARLCWQESFPDRPWPGPGNPVVDTNLEDARQIVYAAASAIRKQERERLRGLVEDFRARASAEVTGNHGETWPGCKDGETPTSEVWWHAASALEAALDTLEDSNGR